MTAKKIDGIIPDLYEITDVITIQDINGNDVSIPKVLGVFRLSDLQSELADIQAKITTIEALQ